MAFTMDAVASITIAPESLAAASAVGSAAITNSSGRQGALISCKFTVGTSPAVGGMIHVYLLRTDDHSSQVVTDAWTESSGSITIVNATRIGSLYVSATTSDVAYQEIFDTWSAGVLGPKWGIAVLNSTSVTSNSTAGNFVFNQQMYGW